MLVLAGIIILGILAQWLAWRTKVPAILPLILIGLLVGPLSTLWTADGLKLIEPIYNSTTGTGLFPGNYLFYFVSLSIGIILFEGGLTLKMKEIQEVGPSIFRLITAGSLITFIGAGLAAHFFMNLSWSISFLFGALIIVTGPTVIAPILQNVPLNRNVSTVLKWEGILIDPIGALAAVLVFEFIVSSDGAMQFAGHSIKEFAKIILIGLSLGVLSAIAMKQLIKLKLIPHYLLNVFALAMVLGVFVFSDLLAHESGLLAVVVMGMAMANMDVPNLHEILYFKESLSVLLISILFILLAANIDIADLQLLMDWRCLALFATVVFVLRPLTVFWSTRDSSLSLNEKLFVSWVGPRGIVAAGIASLFGIKLTLDGVEGANYITPLVFMIVLGTVLLNATTARMVAKLLKVIQEASNGILMVGANLGTQILGKYLRDNGRHVVIIDNNEKSIEKAKKNGLEAIQANVYTDDLQEHFDLLDAGYLFAMTSSYDVNITAVEKLQKDFGEKGAYRLLSADEMKMAKEELPVDNIFSYYDDFLNINEVVRDHPNIHEIGIESKEQLEATMKTLNEQIKCVPLFLKDGKGFHNVIPFKADDVKIEEGLTLVYLGQKVEF